MPLYRNGPKMVLFVHIPKTGGSTVEEVLKAAGGLQALKYHKRLGYSNSTPQHMHWDVLGHWIPKAFYDVAFCTVRAPFARLVSEYRWRRSLSQKPVPAFDDWIIQSFESWTKNPHLYDNHIRPQTDFIGPRVKVFRLEDGLEAPVSFGLGALGLADAKPPIHHARKSERDPLQVSVATLDKVRSFYGRDYEVLGYRPEDDVPEEVIVLPNVG
jgi:hypothetical protein